MYKYNTQIEYMKLMGALESASITKSQKRGALRAINLIKDIRYRKLKGSMCAYGRSQICYIPKEDTSSPTIYLEEL